MDTLTFLKSVVTCTPGHESHAYMKLLSREEGEKWICWSDVLGGASTGASPDTFFTPHLYDNPHGSILDTRTVAIDAGDSDLLYLPLQPSYVVNTSAERNQVYFIFEESVEEAVARQIAGSLESPDPLSIKFGYLLRMPNTINTKYGQPYPVRVTQSSGYIHKIENLIPSTNGIHTFTEDDMHFTIPADLKPLRFIEEIAISPLAKGRYSTKLGDTRSQKAALVDFINECLRIDVPKGIILALAKNHANNYLGQLSYHQEEELKKLILYLSTTAHVPNSRDEILKARNQANTMEVRCENVATVVREHMKKTGTFSHTRDDLIWYIPNNKQPIMLSGRSPSLLHYLDREFGLNKTDPDTSYTVSHLMAFCDSLPKVSTLSRLSHYDRSANRMLINTGANQLIAITPSQIEQVPNGTHGIILTPMDQILIPFMPRDRPLPKHWSEIVFEPIMQHVLILEPEETRAVMAAWFLFLLFKNDAVARPILTILGQPGSGKSTIMKRICILLYGKVSGFMAISNRDDFDQITSTYPFVVLDNLDTWEKWLPDALAQSSSGIDRGKKKLYTDDELFIYHRDAMVSITAHDPKFGRPDVADRLLILPMKRLEKFESEGDLLRLDRAVIWHHIIQDIQNILATPQPKSQVQLRVMDFSTMGSWIASGLGLLDEFQSALVKLQSQQRSFALEGDQILTSAILNYTTKSKHTDEFRPLGQLYMELELRSGDAETFNKKYPSPQKLDQRLWAAMDAIKSICRIEFQRDHFNRREWRIQTQESGAEDDGSNMERSDT